MSAFPMTCNIAHIRHMGQKHAVCSSTSEINKKLESATNNKSLSNEQDINNCANIKGNFLKAEYLNDSRKIDVFKIKHLNSPFRENRFSFLSYSLPSNSSINFEQLNSKMNCNKYYDSEIMICKTSNNEKIPIAIKAAFSKLLLYKKNSFIPKVY